MSRLLLIAVLLFTGWSTSAQPALAADAAPGAVAAAGSSIDIRLFELAAVRRLFNTLVQQRAAMSDGDRAAAAADLSQLVQAVTGTMIDAAKGAGFTLDELEQAARTSEPRRVSATPGVMARDAAAYQLLALGYSVREAADVVGGRISVAALDMARKMIVAGSGRDVAADYLDAQYKRLLALRQPVETPQPQRRGFFARFAPTAFDAAISHYAGLHQVDEAIVRAVIATESAFNPGAVSRAGAIGLMQLMPGTAHELGVNPWVPEQNIEGGVRYLSSLIKMFGGLELALVAYNGGPGFAQRYARGQAALYGETRDYVKKVMERIQRFR